MDELKQQFLNVTINFPIAINTCEAHIDSTEFAKRLEYRIHDWDDGRYSYPRELMQDGLERLIKVAIYEVVEKKMLDLHGRTDKAICDEKYSHETIRIMGKTYPWMGDQIKVSARDMTEDEYYER